MLTPNNFLQGTSAYAVVIIVTDPSTPYNRSIHLHDIIGYSFQINRTVFFHITFAL